MPKSIKLKETVAGYDVRVSPANPLAEIGWAARCRIVEITDVPDETPLFDVADAWSRTAEYTRMAPEHAATKGRHVFRYEEIGYGKDIIKR